RISPNAGRIMSIPRAASAIEKARRAVNSTRPSLIGGAVDSTPGAYDCVGPIPKARSGIVEEGSDVIADGQRCGGSRLRGVEHVERVLLAEEGEVVHQPPVGRA